MARGKKSGGDDILAAVRKAALAEADVDEAEKPDYVDIDGVRYYRAKPVAGAAPKKRNAEGEILEQITINLAPHAPHIRLDNKLYFNGYTYWFTEAQVPTIHEIMYNTWRHERATGGANVAAGAARNIHMSGHGAITGSRGPIGVPGA